MLVPRLEVETLVLPAFPVVGGWQVSGIFSHRTGTPLTFTGSNSLNLGTGGTATLDQIAPIAVLGGINTGNPWFSTTSFARAPTSPAVYRLMPSCLPMRV